MVNLQCMLGGHAELPLMLGLPSLVQLPLVFTCSYVLQSANKKMLKEGPHLHCTQARLIDYVVAAFAAGITVMVTLGVNP